MFRIIVGYVDEETRLTTKGTKKNTKITKQLERRGVKPKEYLCSFAFYFVSFVVKILMAWVYLPLPLSPVCSLSLLSSIMSTLSAESPSRCLQK